MNRVKIMTDGHTKWLTLPVKAPIGTLIKDVVITTTNWRETHLSKLESAYRKSPYFPEVWPFLRDSYQASAGLQSLADVNIGLLNTLCQRFELETEFRLASRIDTKSKISDDRLIALVKALNGRVYLSGHGAIKYQDPEKFKDENIELKFSKFDPTPYEQQSDIFTPGLSIVDVLFNIGFDKSRDYFSAQKPF